MSQHRDFAAELLAQRERVAEENRRLVDLLDEFARTLGPDVEGPTKGELGRKIGRFIGSVGRGFVGR